MQFFFFLKKKILCAQVKKNAFNFLLKVADKVSMSSMIRPQTFPIFQKKMYLLKVTLFSSVTIWEREQSAWNLYFLTVNFLNFHLKWEVKTYAEVKVGDFHAVSKFPLGHYAQGETHNVGCKEKQKILIMSSLKSHLDSIRNIICMRSAYREVIHSFYARSEQSFVIIFHYYLFTTSKKAWILSWWEYFTLNFWQEINLHSKTIDQMFQLFCATLSYIIQLFGMIPTKIKQLLANKKQVLGMIPTKENHFMPTKNNFLF